MKVLSKAPSIGELIQELYLKPTGLSCVQAASLCNISEEEFTEILVSNKEIGFELAYKLGKGFNTSHNFWLNAQQDWLNSKE